MADQKRIVVVAGGEIGSWALDYLQSGDVLAGADRGALFLVRNGLQPDVAIGDFDSVTEAEFAEIRRKSRKIVCCDPVMKDLTDTEMAFEWAAGQNPSSILLLGVTGTRLDHTLANLQLLLKAAERGIPCQAVNDHNEISLLSGPCTHTMTKGLFDVVSLLPFGREASGITLQGFRYPLVQASLTAGRSLGVSNIIEQDLAAITLEQGDLLVIRSRD